IIFSAAGQVQERLGGRAAIAAGGRTKAAPGDHLDGAVRIEALDGPIVPGRQDHAPLGIGGDAGRVVQVGLVGGPAAGVADEAAADHRAHEAVPAAGAADAVVVPVQDPEATLDIDVGILGPVELGLGERLAIAVVAGVACPGD